MTPVHGAGQPCALPWLPSPLGLFHCQEHLADILALVDVLVGCRGLSQGERFPDQRLDFAVGIELKKLVDFPL
jgi:hypothetical protein